jgi:hypothetical protein
MKKGGVSGNGRRDYGEERFLSETPKRKKRIRFPKDLGNISPTDA